MTTRSWMGTQGRGASRRCRLLGVLAGTVLAAACGGAGPDDDPSARGLAAKTATAVVTSATEPFDDVRDYGRFAIRKDALGDSGMQHSMDGSRFIEGDRGEHIFVDTGHDGHLVLHGGRVAPGSKAGSDR